MKSDDVAVVTENLGNGGPAFPIASEVMGHCDGMALRQWYAGQALLGIRSEPWTLTDEAADLIADQAFRIADAMLRRSAK